MAQEIFRRVEEKYLLTREKKFIDELRCRNGNLDIACGRVSTAADEL